MTASTDNPPLRAILFDLGDTLLDFGPISHDEMFRLGAKEAYEYLLELGHRLPSWRRYHWRHWLAIRWHVILAVLQRREFHSLPVLVRCCKRLGIELSPEEQLELCWRFYLPLRNIATVEPGLADMLVDLQARGLTISIVSNTFVPGEILDRHLREEGLLEHLPLRVYSCDVGYRKPHIEIYRRALETVGTKPEETMFIGDTPKADVIGPGKLGMITVLKDPTTQRKGRQHADYCLTKIMDLPTILEHYQLGGAD
ncbi:MAG: HAD family hydrolase [Phycisphaerales bacterium]|jgi:HAD superfamily hydrolase (TIGR01509 family)|nr:HAD family hydrolase [Phycisphaerales bacterium]MBT7171806.1 HAD family hydrolase [Phycisphaerales bacterium]